MPVDRLAAVRQNADSYGPSNSAHVCNGLADTKTKSPSGHATAENLRNRNSINHSLSPARYPNMNEKATNATSNACSRCEVLDQSIKTPS